MNDDHNIQKSIIKPPAGPTLPGRCSGSGSAASLEIIMNAAKANANVKCPCGQPLQVRLIGNSYDIMSIECPDCGRTAAGGNTRTGQVTSWMTPTQVSRANAEYESQMFSADMNEFCGRGEW